MIDTAGDCGSSSSSSNSSSFVGLGAAQWQYTWVNFIAISNGPIAHEVASTTTLI